MMMHNISVVGPDEADVAIEYGNALQLHSDSYSSVQYAHDPSSLVNAVDHLSSHIFPMQYLTPPEKTQPVRPQLPHLQMMSENSHRVDNTIPADYPEYSATSNSLAAPQVAYSSGNIVNPVSPSPTYLSGSPLSQGLSPLTPCTPFTSVSSPEVPQTFQISHGNQNEVHTSVEQSDFSLSCPRQGRPMQHTASQPDLRAQSLRPDNYPFISAYTYSPTNGHYTSMHSSPTISSWASPSQAYSPNATSTYAYENVDQSGQHFPSEMHRDYKPSSFSTLTGAVPITDAMTRTYHSSQTGSSHTLQYESCGQTTANDISRSVDRLQAAGSLPQVRSNGVAAAYSSAQFRDDMLNNVVSPFPQRRQPPPGTRQNQLQQSTPSWQPIQMSFNGLRTPGPVVPQVKYRPATASDHRRYVIEADLNHPICFTKRNGTSVGISLTDALQMRWAELDNGDVNCLQNCGPSISLRLLWVGYPAWTKQIATKDYKHPPQPLTVAKLSRHVSRALEKYLEDMATHPMDPKENPCWQIGTNGIKHEDLILLSLEHVSKGSWQIHLCLRSPFPRPFQ